MPRMNALQKRLKSIEEVQALAAQGMYKGGALKHTRAATHTAKPRKPRTPRGVKSNIYSSSVEQTGQLLHSQLARINAAQERQRRQAYLQPLVGEFYHEPIEVAPFHVTVSHEPKHRVTTHVEKLAQFQREKAASHHKPEEIEELVTIPIYSGGKVVRRIGNRTITQRRGKSGNVVENRPAHYQHTPQYIAKHGGASSGGKMVNYHRHGMVVHENRPEHYHHTPQYMQTHGGKMVNYQRHGMVIHENRPEHYHHTAQYMATHKGGKMVDYNRHGMVVHENRPEHYHHTAQFTAAHGGATSGGRVRKTNRPISAYQEFVKENYQMERQKLAHQHPGIAPRELNKLTLSGIAQMWR
jgi:hypothetical protein